ncbi:MAG: hypothetical protein CMM01_17310 [Rhodopirellula sp.]|nr:hypothetical protein [Rhodopirellula sp.]OUX50102.1 MAG: hypothetical protein CBE43_08055 [Rhodopirellula sp. TMED283]
MNPNDVCNCLYLSADFFRNARSSEGVEPKEAATFKLIASRGNGDYCQLVQQCECLQCDCAGNLRKHNLFKRSMHVLIRYLHRLLPSPKAFDES